MSLSAPGVLPSSSLKQAAMPVSTSLPPLWTGGATSHSTLSPSPEPLCRECLVPASVYLTSHSSSSSSSSAAICWYHCSSCGAEQTWQLLPQYLQVPFTHRNPIHLPPPPPPPPPPQVPVHRWCGRCIAQLLPALLPAVAQPDRVLLQGEMPQP